MQKLSKRFGPLGVKDEVDYIHPDCKLPWKFSNEFIFLGDSLGPVSSIPLKFNIYLIYLASVGQFAEAPLLFLLKFPAL